MIHIWALSGRDTDNRRYISPLPFLSFTKLFQKHACYQLLFLYIKYIPVFKKTTKDSGVRWEIRISLAYVAYERPKQVIGSDKWSWQRRKYFNVKMPLFFSDLGRIELRSWPVNVNHEWRANNVSLITQHAYCILASSRRQVTDTSRTIVVISTFDLRCTWAVDRNFCTNTWMVLLFVRNVFRYTRGQHRL